MHHKGFQLKDLEQDQTRPHSPCFLFPKIISIAQIRFPPFSAFVNQLFLSTNTEKNQNKTKQKLIEKKKIKVYIPR